MTTVKATVLSSLPINLHREGYASLNPVQFSNDWSDISVCEFIGTKPINSSKVM